MGTRCYICKQLDDNRVRGIYCHFGGMLGRVGRKLLTNYSDETKIDELLDLGSIASLWNSPSMEDGTEAYIRDRHKDAKVYSAFICASGHEIESGSDIEYVYLWRNGGWYCAVLRDGNKSYEWLPNIVGYDL